MKEKNKLKIAVATHKKFQMPTQAGYFPLHVGKSCHEQKLEEYVGDDTGDNISDKNPFFCELTGLYWLWKNTDSEYVGMVHYRRYFKTLKKCHGKNQMNYILRESEAIRFLQKYDMILPRKRQYIIETLYTHYSHTHYEEHLECMRNILMEKESSYVPVFDKVMKRRSAHMYNMFIAKREICDAYCAWLFPLLMELEKRSDPGSYDPFQARLIGRVGELLMDVWVEKNNIHYCEVPVLYMEKVNWIHKGKAFLKAKFLGEKYAASF